MQHEWLHRRMCRGRCPLPSDYITRLWSIHDIRLPGPLFFFPKLYQTAPLSPPANFRGHNLGSRSIELSWGQGPKSWRNEAVLGFHLVCIGLHFTEEHFENLSSGKLKWVFKGMRKFTNYSCRLRAYNKFRNGTWSKRLVISTDEDGMS